MRAPQPRARGARLAHEVGEAVGRRRQADDLVAAARERDGERAPDLGRGARDAHRVLGQRLPPHRLEHGGRRQRVAVDDLHGVAARLAARAHGLAAAVEPLGLVQRREADVADARALRGVDGGLELALDRGPLALVEVEARGDGQAPRRDLRAAVLVALHDRRRQEQLREARPDVAQRPEQRRDPARRVRDRAEERRHEGHVRDHGGHVVAVREEDDVRRPAPARAVRDLAVERLRRRVRRAAEVVPDGAEEAVVPLVLGVVQRVVARRVDVVLERAPLGPAREALEVAVARAVHDVEPARKSAGERG